MTHKISQTMCPKNILTACVAAALFTWGCSSDRNERSSARSSASVMSSSVASTDIAAVNFLVFSFAPSIIEVEFESVLLSFTAANGSVTVAVSGDGSPVAEWLANQPGEMPLDLVDADTANAVSVVDEMISFWFFQDGSRATPSSIYVSSGGLITDSVGTSYFVKSRFLLPVPVAKTITTTGSTITTSSAPETFEPPSSATSSPITSTTTTTMITLVESPVVLQVKVLNGSGVAGAAERMTDKLPQAVYMVFSPVETPQRYSSSAVYFVEGRQANAKDTLQAAEMGEIDQPVSIPRILLEKIKSNLLSVFVVRGFLSITTFIVCRQ